MFFGNVTQIACFVSLPLSAAPGDTHQHVVYDGAPGGGQRVRGQVTGCGEHVRGTRGVERGGLPLHHRRTQQRQNL